MPALLMPVSRFGVTLESTGASEAARSTGLRDIGTFIRTSSIRRSTLVLELLHYYTLKI